MKSSQPAGPHVASTIILIVLCIHQRGGRDSGQWETERPDPWDFANETRLELRGELLLSSFFRLTLVNCRWLAINLPPANFSFGTTAEWNGSLSSVEFAAIIAIRVLMNRAKEDKEWYIEYFVLVSLLI